MARRKDSRFGLPAHVHAVHSKGRTYFYFQEGRGSGDRSARVRLKGEPFAGDGTPSEDWWREYRRVSGMEEGERRPGSFRMLAEEFQKSPEWAGFSPNTQREWARLMPAITGPWGDLAVRSIQPHHILKLRDKYARHRAKANNVLNLLSAMLSWAVPRGYLKSNPCIGMRRLKLRGAKPYEPWSWDEIQLFESVARPIYWHAVALALYTGQRQADVLKMQGADVRGDLIAVVQNKTGKKLWITMHRRLKVLVAQLLEAGQGRSHLLVDMHGQPWDSARFKTNFQRQMRVAALKPLKDRKLVFHGIRKSAVVMLLEAGCTDAEVAAITGQTREMVAHYALAVNQKRLAAAAILKWERAEEREVA